MRDQKFITKLQYQEARSRDLESVQESPKRGSAPYFTEYVRRLLEKEDTELNINIYRDGLKIFTTLDSRLQEIAEDAVLKTVIDDQSRLNKRLFNNREEFESLAYLTIYSEDSIKMMLQGDETLYKDLRGKLLVQSAFVALDPNTGGILAMVGQT